MREPNGTFTVVDAFGSGGTQITAVNSRGLVAGDNDYLSDNPGFLRYRNGEFGTLYVPGSSCAVPVAMNDSGEIVGVACLFPQAIRGFIWSPGHSLTFSVPNAGIWVGVTALNSSGVVAGAYLDRFEQNMRHAFIRDSAGNVTSFDATDNAVATEATAINASGQVAGWYLDASKNLSPFFRDVNGTITLFTAGTGTQGQATGINDDGVVVGSAYNDISENAFERDAAGNITILTLPFSNLASAAVAINLSGVIVGTYYDQASAVHGWVMTP
jgi:uncharacterized membrane protein